MRPRAFFWTTFFFLVVAILLSSTFFGILLYRHLNASTLEDRKAGLRREARLLADMAIGSPELIRQPQRITHLVHTEDRITILALDGSVVADNWMARVGKSAMGNHSDRPEFQGALHDHPIYQRRFSHEIGTEMLYYAVPFKADGKTVLVFRVSSALTVFHAQMTDIRHMLYGFALINVLLSLPFALLFSQRITRPIHKLRAGSRSIAQGDLSRRVPVEGSTEFRDLASDFNSMADELQQKIESLRRERTQIETLLARMVEGVVALDPSGRAVFANAAFAGMNDSKPERIVGRHYLEFTRNSQLIDRIAEQLSDAASISGEASEIRMFGRDGEKVYSMQASPIRDEASRLSLLLLVFHDITRIKRVEQVRRDFVANISHELRTPLTAAAGSIEILLDGAYRNQSESKRFLQIVDKQLHNMQNLVDDMLRLATVEDMHMPLRRENVQIRPFLEEIVAIFRPLAARKKQSLALELPEQPPWASIDPGQIGDALANLLDNAVKYCNENGAITLQVTADRDVLAFAVHDNGPGILADQLPRIFERFYRIDKSRSRELGGTGLGLSIAKHAVENHGGTISVESRPGLGTTFHIILPAVVMLPGSEAR